MSQYKTADDKKIVAGMELWSTLGTRFTVTDPEVPGNPRAAYVKRNRGKKTTIHYDVSHLYSTRLDALKAVCTSLAVEVAHYERALRETQAKADAAHAKMCKEQFKVSRAWHDSFLTVK